MHKTILITGATAGVGLETAKALSALGHRVLLHGRNATRLVEIEGDLSARPGAGPVESYVADLSRMSEVEALAKAVAAQHRRLDVLINNAGVFQTPERLTPDGFDVRFAVNTLAPYLLTRRLFPLLTASSRVINLSSAAQTSVDVEALKGQVSLSAGVAYAQSKLALTMWSREVARALGAAGPVIVAVNPGSMLGTQMVKDAFGVAGKDVGIGADILVRASLSEEFAGATGQYFDNDAGQFAPPHPDALDPRKSAEVVMNIEVLVSRGG